MKNRLVPRAILFEPDRRNRVNLGANLLINGPLDRPWGVRTITFADPGGHIWEIAQDLPRPEGS